MNEKTSQDLRKIAVDAMNTLKDSAELIQDVEKATSGDIVSGIKVLTKDIPNEIADVLDDAKDIGIAAHDALPSGKTTKELSDGEIVTEKYYETDKTFADRIAKDEEHIKQFGNSGE